METKTTIKTVAVIILNSFTKEVGVISCENYEEAEKCLKEMYLDALTEDYINDEKTYIDKDNRYAQVNYGIEITEFRMAEIWPNTY